MIEDHTPGRLYPLLEDYVGHEHNRAWVEDTIYSIANANAFLALGLRPNKRFLITGEPGTGKTFGVNAIVNECTMRGFPLKFHEYNIREQGTAYINMGSVQFGKWYEEAQKRMTGAWYKGTAFILDECDVLFAHRGLDQGHKEDKKLLETIMKVMQESEDKPGEYWFLMTNFPEILDQAAMRAGRIDEHVRFELPDLAARRSLLQYAIEQQNQKAGYQIIRNFNLMALARATEGFNNPELIDVPRKALYRRVSQMVRERDKRVITQIYVRQNRLMESIDAIRAGKQKAKVKRRIGFLADLEEKLAE